MPRGRSSSPDKTTLEAALVGLELKRSEIDALIAKIKKQLGGKAGASPAAPLASPVEKSKPGRKKKRVLSAEAIKRIAAAQRRRWAEHRKAQSKSES